MPRGHAKCSLPTFLGNSKIFHSPPTVLCVPGLHNDRGVGKRETIEDCVSGECHCVRCLEGDHNADKKREGSGDHHSNAVVNNNI